MSNQSLIVTKLIGDGDRNSWEKGSFSSKEKSLFSLLLFFFTFATNWIPIPSTIFPIDDYTIIFHLFLYKINSLFQFEFNNMILYSSFVPWSSSFSFKHMHTLYINNFYHYQLKLIIFWFPLLIPGWATNIDKGS